MLPVSFQTEGPGIPTRPAHIWIEIAPLAPNRTAAGQRYVFFDECYEANLPVPLIRCRCGDWPTALAMVSELCQSASFSARTAALV